tara:strand:+ start:21603 stop:22151 length:549 start_codon:yes stop_codon:yes gene_type:complete
MTLDKWTTGDVITEGNINKRGIRRGTTSDRGSATTVVGDHYFNEDEDCTQVKVSASPEVWMNAGRVLLGADSNETAVTGTTATQVKDIDVIKHTSTWAGYLVLIVARIKSSNGSHAASLRVRLNGAGSDSLVLTSSSTSYAVVKGTIDVSSLAAGRHTIELFLDSANSSSTATMDMTEIWGS